MVPEHSWVGLLAAFPDDAEAIISDIKAWAATNAGVQLYSPRQIASLLGVHQQSVAGAIKAAGLRPSVMVRGGAFYHESMIPPILGALLELHPGARYIPRRIAATVKRARKHRYPTAHINIDQPWAEGSTRKVEVELAQSTAAALDAEVAANGWPSTSALLRALAVAYANTTR